MSEDKYLVRAPLLDPKQQVMGYKLSWQDHGSLPPGDADLDQLLSLVAERASDTGLGRLFLDARPARCSAETLQTMAPPDTVLVLNRADLADGDDVTAATTLREHGFSLAIGDADLAFLESSESLLPLLSHVELGLDHPDLTTITSLAGHAEPPLAVVLAPCRDWEAFDACAALGLSGFFGNLCLAPRKQNQPGELGPQTVLILQLMQMVQENADVRHLEKLLKRDAVLSYKLFRYINSASFGIEVEIQSLRHAVAMIGYTPLFRWLSLLLAMTNTVGFSPALLQAAIVRGRLTELLGQGLLSRGESDDLFVVGMFSLLGQMLGVPITQVLSQIVLPDAIVQALISREGKYGPFLLLAEACEREDGCSADHADNLFVTAKRVNDAHLLALAWAQNIKL